MSMVSGRTTIRRSRTTSKRITLLKFLTRRSSILPTSQPGCLKMRNSRSSIVGACMLTMVLTMAALVQAQPGPAVAKLCEVFSSPAEYNHKVASVEGVISPSIHSLFLSSPACNAKEDPDFTTQAVLPASWETLPNGKELRKYLRRGKSASVKLTGTFEADPQRYGPDGARFRFSISGISSVGAAPPGFHL